MNSSICWQKLCLLILSFFVGITIFHTNIRIVLGQEVPIYIYERYTTIKPSPVQVNQTATLRICVDSKSPSDLPCSLKVYGDQNCLEIFPVEEQNVTAFADRYSYFPFSVRSNTTGTFSIKIELWYQNHQIDFHMVTLEASGERIISILSYEFRVSFVFLFSLFTILVVYFAASMKAKYDETGEIDDVAFWIMLILSVLLWIVMIFAIKNGSFYSGLSYFIAPSIGKIELVLALALIISLTSWILLPKRLDISLRLGNVLIFLITIPIILDWLLIPNIPSPETLVGRITWQLIEIAVASVIAYFLDIIFQRKRQERLDRV